MTIFVQYGAWQPLLCFAGVKQEEFVKCGGCAHLRLNTCCLLAMCLVKVCVDRLIFVAIICFNVCAACVAKIFFVRLPKNNVRLILKLIRRK